MHYRKHIFCCINEREPNHPRSCCSARGSVELRAYMKSRAKQLGLNDVRINNAGCLERCEFGPTMVIYPQGTWYHYESVEDIDEILQSDVIEGQKVDRLRLKDGQKYPHASAFLRLKLKVAAVDSVAHDKLRIEFVNCVAGNLPAFTAGSHIDLLIGERGIRRSYSLINNPQETDRYVVAVLKEKDSRGGSKWIHDEMRVGDVVEASYPQNNFQLDESAQSSLLIAGGIGIAPILSMCYRLKTINAEFSVHYCARSEQEAGFVEELKSVCEGRLTMHFDDGNPKNGIDLDAVLAQYRPDNHLYVCGPASLMAAAFDKASHWPKDALHKELFHRVIPAKWDNHEFDVVLARRQITVRVASDKSILETLQDQNITSDFSCTEGLCGACRTRVLHGNVEHRDLVLDEREKTQGTMMVCVSRAAAGESQLILDI